MNFDEIKKELEAYVITTPINQLEKEKVNEYLVTLEYYHVPMPDFGTLVYAYFDTNVNYTDADNKIKNKYKVKLNKKLVATVFAIATLISAMFLTNITYATKDLITKFTTNNTRIFYYSNNPIRPPATIDKSELLLSKSYTIEQVKSLNYSKLYLPLDLLDNPDNVSFGLLPVRIRDSILSVKYKNEDIWINIYVQKGARLAQDLKNYTYLPNLLCKWNDSKFYYHPYKKETFGEFTTYYYLYYVESNLKPSDVLRIINSMEVLKGNEVTVQ